MLSFSPKRWEVRHLKDMASLACLAPDTGEISMATYMAVKPVSAWADIEELVKSQDYMITGSEDDAAELFLASLEKYKLNLVEHSNRGDLAGICMRWLLGTRRDSTQVLLLAQVKLFRIE